MIYTVKTRYEDFTFDSEEHGAGTSAMALAEILVEHSTENIHVEITVSKGGDSE